MKKFLILVSGNPGTGKSYLCKMIKNKYSSFNIISPDDIKEKYWDKYGFKDTSEKNLLIEQSWKEYFDTLSLMMTNDKNILSDYPFSNKQKNILLNLANQFKYRVITIRMIADLDILFERQKKRDLDPTRHLGHILNSYNPKIKTLNRYQADGLLSYNEFINRCQTRGYDTFVLGELLTIDVSDFSKALYNELLLKLDDIFNKE